MRGQVRDIERSQRGFRRRTERPGREPRAERSGSGKTPLRGAKPLPKVWEIASALEPIFSAHPLAMWIAKASGFFPPMKPPLSFSTDRQTLSDFLGHADYAGLTTRRCAKDGTIIDTEIHGVPLTVNGVCAGAYGIYQDIRDRKRLEEEMRFGQKCRLSAGWQGLLTPVKNGAIMAGVGRGH